MINRELESVLHPVSALLLAACLLSGCMTGGDGGSGAVTSGFLKKDQGTYRIEGGNIINENRFRTYFYCSLGEIVSETDTLKNDTIPFELAGNTLSLINPSLDTMESGAVVQYLVQAMRMGRGASLNGLWQFTGQSYRVLAGALSPVEKTRVEEDNAKNNGHLDITTFQWQFSDGLITTFEDTKTAEAFLLAWNKANIDGLYPADSARYDIAVKVVGKYQVELKGRITEETVLLTLENDRSETFQSSDPAHPMHRFDRIPKSCPDDTEPGWYGLFLQANSKAGTRIEKRGAPDGIPHSSPQPTWFP